MTDLTRYRDKVAKVCKDAHQADEDKEYERAFHLYTNALDIFTHLIKWEQNQKLTEIYKMKAEEYLQRAEYIKKEILLN